MYDYYLWSPRCLSIHLSGEFDFPCCLAFLGLTKYDLFALWNGIVWLRRGSMINLRGRCIVTIPTVVPSSILLLNDCINLNRSYGSSNNNGGGGSYGSSRSGSNNAGTIGTTSRNSGYGNSSVSSSNYDGNNYSSSYSTGGSNGNSGTTGTSAGGSNYYSSNNKNYSYGGSGDASSCKFSDLNFRSKLEPSCSIHLLALYCNIFFAFII